MTRGHIFARVGFVNGRTRLIEHHQNAPLKIARCFPTDCGGLEICVMDASPGLLAADCNDFEWIVEAGARLRVTTQGATRVHPSDGPISRQQVRFRVAAGARLELWPHTVIPFRAARFRSEIRGHLEGGAQLMLLESLSAGRIARGEKFQFESVDSRIQLFGPRGPLLCLQNRYAPAEFSAHQLAGWGEATQLTGLFGFGFDDDRLALAVTRQVLEQHQVLTLSGSASLLAWGGVALLTRGQRAHDGSTLAREVARAWSCDRSRWCNIGQNPS